MLRCAALTFLLLSATAFAAPRWVRVTVPGTDAATSMVVAWNSDATTEPSTVEYGAAPAALDKTATGSAAAAKGTLGSVHEVTLTGLLPDTKYHYRVGGAGAWSDVHHFRTGPADACTPFTFIASGDHRSDDDAGPNPKWASILGEMAASGARFILETGDLVKDGADLKQWVNHMTMGASHMGEVALMPSFGNHDSDDVQGAAAAYNQLFALPTNDVTGTEDFYAFTYGSVVIAALSTATFDDAAGLAKQAAWLDATFTKHADKLWKFVYFHHPCFTSHIDLKLIELNHPPDEKGQNAAFVPIFDKHHVDVVFAGHNHFYERFQPMKGGSPVASPKDGTLYVTTGGAGAFTYDEIDVLGFKIEPMKVICGDGFLGFSGKAKGSALCSGKHHYVEVNIDKNVLSATVRSTAAQNLSTGAQNQGVIDTWKITKDPLPDGACAPPPPVDTGAVAEPAAPDTAATAEPPPAVAEPAPAPDPGVVPPTPDPGPTPDAGTVSADSGLVIDLGGTGSATTGGATGGSATTGTSTPAAAASPSEGGCAPSQRGSVAFAVFLLMLGLVGRLRRGVS